MKLFAKIASSLQPSTIFIKSSIIDVWQIAKYAFLFFLYYPEQHMQRPWYYKHSFNIFLKTEYFHSSSNDFLLNYNAFYCERDYQEMQTISGLNMINSK